MFSKRFFLILIFIYGCGRPDGVLESIGNGYQLYYWHRTVDLLNRDNIYLLGDIRGFTKNDSFILAYRKVDFTGMSDEKEDKKWLKHNPNDSIQYWIIRTTNDSVYGPMKLQDYLVMRTELKLSSSIMLRLDKDSVTRDGF